MNVRGVQAVKGARMLEIRREIWGEHVTTPGVVIFHTQRTRPVPQTPAARADAMQRLLDVDRVESELASVHAGHFADIIDELECSRLDAFNDGPCGW